MTPLLVYKRSTSLLSVSYVQISAGRRTDVPRRAATKSVRSDPAAWMDEQARTRAEHLAASSMSEPPLCCHQYKCYVADLATTTTTTVLEHLLLIACESHGFNGKPTYFPRNTWPLLVLRTTATSFYNFILTVQLPRREFLRLDFEIYQTPIIFTCILT